MNRNAGFRRLSLLETRVARLVAEGLSDEQVAVRLGLVPGDVDVQLAGVFRKLGLRSRTELALLAPEGPESGPANQEIDGTQKEPTP